MPGPPRQQPAPAPTAVAAPEPDDRRRQLREAGAWAGLVVLGLLLTAVAVHAHARVGSAAAPFTGAYRAKIRLGSPLAPAVAVTAVLAVRSRLTDRLSWRWLLVIGYLAAAGWALSLALVDGGNGLASPITAPTEYLQDVASVHGDPLAFLDTFTRRAAPGPGQFSVATRTHPPAPVLLLWVLTRVGITSPEALGLLLTLAGCLHVPFIAVSVRSLCHEAAGRALLPLLVLAPYAVWLAVSMDAVTLSLGAGLVALGVVGSEPGRSRWWALDAGLVLGVAAMFNYAAAWLGFTVLAVNFVRRRPLLNVIAAVGAMVPLALATLAGFSWLDGLAAARDDFSVRGGPQRSWLLWVALDLLLLLIACGPAVVRASRRLRTTPGWPFLAGAGLAIVFALASGLSRGEVERSWLAFFPWLLVAAVAPLHRPAGPGEPEAAPTPVLLLGLGAAGAIVVQAALRTTW